MMRVISYREFLTGQAASAISCLADALDNGTRMDSEYYAVQHLQAAFGTARALLAGAPNPEMVEPPPSKPKEE